MRHAVLDWCSLGGSSKQSGRSTNERANARSGGRVLVIDDEPLLRATLEQVLSDEGYVVEVAADGAEGLQRAQRTRPDVILLDLMMPTMNGKQFLQALRAEPNCETLPVLIMTAVHGIHTNLALLGASEVLQKPFEAEDLLSKVALAMYRSRLEWTEPVPAAGGGVTTAVSAGISIEPVNAPAPQGVVLLVDPDRSHLQQLDRELSARGYTVVSMTRSLVDLCRLSFALSPVVVAVAATSPHADELLVPAGAPCPVVIYGGRRANAAEPRERGQQVWVVPSSDDCELLYAVEQAATQGNKVE